MVCLSCLKVSRVETEKITLKTFLEALSIVIILEAILQLIPFKEAGVSYLLLGAIRILEIISLILLFYFQSKNIAALRLSRSGFGFGLKRGLIWSIIFGIFVIDLFCGLYLFNIDPFEWIRMSLPGRNSDLIVFFLVGGLIGPVAEEVFFRGVLYGFFRRWGIIPALLLSTFFFILAHIQFNPLPLTQTIGGILFALVYELEKNLYSPIVIHVLGNLAIFSLSLFF